ncbi:conserved protein of unknown function [Pseudomonas marincola]|uniref:Uncharacterized protein n=1 Tax=Pseudomonas marincola TaxID=437900 RepID=A0A653DXM5_9PSED|nr:conserved protein of unknown function [Pseudomonas marincola]
MAGGWNPHRGFRHDGLTDSLDGIGACEMARRIALLRAAIHPPVFHSCLIECLPAEVGIRLRLPTWRSD